MPPFVPTDAMAEEAQRGIDWRKEFNRGGTRVGATRARQIVNKDNLSLETVKRMHSFFSRHERATKNGQGFKRGEKGYPSAGRIAWALWGGDSGQTWARRIVSKYRDMNAQNSITTFQVGLNFIDADAGVISDVSIIEAGEAKGHQMMVSESSLASAMEELRNARLPAYITHANAMGDRLTEEVGYFSEFYQEGNKIKARRFQAFQAFRRYKPEQYDALFEMAEEMPENFGISLVFEAALFWELADGEKEEYRGLSSRPEDALFEVPSVEMISIQSADFVDNPAANSSLFSTEVNQESIMKTELTTAASDAFEKAQAEEVEKNQASEQPVEAKDAPKKKSRKKLEEAPVEEAPVVEAAETEEVDAQLEAAESKIENLENTVNELKAQVELLQGIVGGSDAVEEDFAEEVSEKTTAELKAEAVALMLEQNPSMKRPTALLEVGKINPEYFNN